MVVYLNLTTQEAEKDYLYYKFDANLVYIEVPV